ncbi:MAG: S8 family serine peptidase, partial [Vicinamibacteraceae bacterium]
MEPLSFRSSSFVSRRSAWLTSVLTLGLALLVSSAAVAGPRPHRARLSSSLETKLAAGFTTTDVIVRGDADRLARLAETYGARVKKRLRSGAVLTVTHASLEALVTDASVDAIANDDLVVPTMAVTSEATGADQAWEGIAGIPGLTGRGVRVALVDSGIVDSHPALGQRVVLHVDFTGGDGRDAYGHGTHVAGIVAGNGDGFKGMAPEAELISLRVLDEEGKAVASTVIEAIEWTIANRERLGIRVLNLSVGKAATSSWRDDPLSQAAQRAVEAGLVVVASAGNQGQTKDGRGIIGAISSPGNAPDVITVGAVDTQATPERSDDVVPLWSSKGPSYLDGFLKPDITAPGRLIRSLTIPGTTLAGKFTDNVSPDSQYLT